MASGGTEIVCRLQCAFNRRLTVLRTPLDAFRNDDLGVRDTDESQRRAEIGFRMLGRGIWCFLPIEAAARDDDDHSLVAGQSLHAVLAVLEGLAGNEDAIDP